MQTVIFHALVLSFSLILPLGVQNVFIFNQGAVSPQYRRVLPVVATAAFCDMLLIGLAVTGVSLIILVHDWVRISLLLVGAVFLTVMGISMWRSRPQSADQHRHQLPVRRQIVFALSVSLLNPHAILDTVGVIGTNSLQYTGMDKIAFAAICMLVSAIWFASLAFAGRQVGKLDGSGAFLGVLNKLSALMMWGIAAYMVYGLTS
ncbi:LysE/ArgO family amino acid transporter [Paenibacillus methanolicus]|uniref:L-lysine exporter family protein LysE/ArgO n=1 Tax=Paenibacillus methanolicus TaxID=582686 RepID=A0A5S5CIG2_9BACL|nr:LysE/ArgO family amino acid transporter [Paenibacillus methanolicus]TYP79579.1 L-lysine exporter family protein LysE/ArgO [Paenibacillus methanolicus]